MWAQVAASLVQPASQIYLQTQAQRNQAAGSYTQLPDRIEYEKKDYTMTYALVSGIMIVLVVSAAVAAIKNVG